MKQRRQRNRASLDEFCGVYVTQRSSILADGSLRDNNRVHAIRRGDMLNSSARLVCGAIPFWQFEEGWNLDPCALAEVECEACHYALRLHDVPDAVRAGWHAASAAWRAADAEWRDRWIAGGADAATPAAPDTAASSPATPPATPSPAPNTGPRFAETEVLTPEIEAFRAGVVAGHSLFVCGRAGVGKSRQLMWVREWASDNGRAIACVAPTGVAAVNVGGQTIHSFFRFPLGALHDKDARKAASQAGDRRKVFETLQILVIDEVSMVRADLMAAIDVALRTARGKPWQPFGGVQIIMFGDVFQLPPILKKGRDNDAERQYLADSFDSTMFFGATGVRGARVIELTKVFRQKERDFALALNDVRGGAFSERAYTLFKARVGVRDATAVTLTTTRAKAAEINGEELARLLAAGATLERFDATLDGTARASDFMAPEVLDLTLGARVMTLVNNVDDGYRNGSVGTVTRMGRMEVVENDKVKTVPFVEIALDEDLSGGTGDPALTRGPGSIARDYGPARPSRREGGVSALRVTIPFAPAATAVVHCEVRALSIAQKAVRSGWTGSQATPSTSLENDQ